MGVSFVARFVDAFIGGFFRTMKERLIDGGLLIAALLYWFLSGKLRSHFWESVEPWIWVVCAILVWHTISAAHLLWREITQGTTNARSSVVLSQYGKPFELPATDIPKYRAQIVGVGMLVVVACIACSYSTWRAAHIRATDDAKSGAPASEETLYATLEMAIVTFGRPNLTGFWHLHGLGQMCAITPVDILAFIRVESTSARASTIAGYKLETGDQKRGSWGLLKKLPMTYGQIVFTAGSPGVPHVGNVMTFPATGTHIYGMNLDPNKADYRDAAIIGLNSLDSQLAIPLSPNTPARGWAAFQGEWLGDWRITIIDSLNKEHSSIVPQVLQMDDSDVMLRLLKVAGVADVSHCEKQ